MASPRPFTSADRPPPQYDDDDSWEDDEKFLFDTFVRASPSLGGGVVPQPRVV